MTISNCPRGSRSAPWATSSTGIIDDESYDHVGFEEKIKLMPERRGPRRAARARSPGSSGRRGSNTRTRASRTSKIPPERKPGRDRIERLASCQWVRDRETLIIIPRHGKREKPRSARPSATPHAAGESPHDTRACRTCPGEIDRARLDGQAAYYRKVDEFKSIDLPVLDDFPATPADAADSILIFEIMEARSSAGATFIASQCGPEQWYVRSGSELIADSTLSRPAGSARYLELEGPDMRRRNTTLSEEKGWKEVTAGTNE